MCSLLYLSLGWPSPAVTIVYSAIQMDHWCTIPDIHNDEKLSLEEQKRQWIPYDNVTNKYDQCHRYDNIQPLFSHSHEKRVNRKKCLSCTIIYEK